MKALKPYTLSDGRTIELRRVSIFTLRAAMDAIPEPEPPVQVIDGVSHKNYQHPDYKAKQLAYEKARSLAADETTFACGIKAPFGDEEKAELAEFRETAKLMGIPLSSNDWGCYATHVLMGSVSDINNVRSLILDGSFPSEEGVSKAAESFKSSVEGATDSGSVDAEIGSDSREP